MLQITKSHISNANLYFKLRPDKYVGMIYVFLTKAVIISLKIKNSCNLFCPTINTEEGKKSLFISYFSNPTI